MSRMKRFIALLLALLSVLSLAACGTADDNKDDYVKGTSAGKELGQTVAADDIFTLNCNKGYSMNPLIATNTNNQLVCCLVYENIVEVDNSFKLNPGVVTSWTTSDGGSRWEFKVASGHKFHDGQQLTATDVAYSVMCAARSDRFKARLSYVAGCSATDSVNLTKKNMQFPMLLTIPIIQYGTYEQAYPGGSGPYAYAEDYNSLVAAKTNDYAAALPLRPVMVFIPEQKRLIVAQFRQNSLLRLEPGDDAEAVFNALPGQVFHGKLVNVLPVVPGGTYQAQGALQSLSVTPGSDGVLATIELDPDAQIDALPDGIYAQVAVYSDHFTHVSVMRKVLLRMTSWMHYLYLDH